MAIPFDQREALQMLAGSPNGSTESILLTHGFGIGTLHDLVRNGLATAETRTVQAGQRMIGNMAEDHRRREAGAGRVE